MTTAPAVNRAFQIAPDERVAVVGATGMGKSFTSTVIINAQKIPFLIVDTKGSDTLTRLGWRVITQLEDIETIGQGRNPPDEKVVWRPRWNATPEEIQREVEIAARWAYQRRNIGFYIDELMEVCPNPHVFPPSVRGIATRGRERVVPLYSSTQRPTGVPLFSISEANHFFVHGLRLPQDRKRMSEAAEFDLDQRIKQLAPRQFLYINPARNIVSGPHTWV